MLGTLHFSLGGTDQHLYPVATSSSRRGPEQHGAARQHNACPYTLSPSTFHCGAPAHARAGPLAHSCREPASPTRSSPLSSCWTRVHKLPLGRRLVIFSAEYLPHCVRPPAGAAPRNSAGLLLLLRAGAQLLFAWYRPSFHLLPITLAPLLVPPDTLAAAASSVQAACVNSFLDAGARQACLYPTQQLVVEGREPSLVTRDAP